MVGILKTNPVYYNEFDPFAAAWLRELIKAGHLPAGDVDERSIEDVRPDDLAGYAQCHFFAGIGGWALALRNAGWPDSRSVWTGSCPCQPFSEAGQGAGFDDSRHLWPSFQWLIEQCRPGVVFGEQVAGKAAEPWIDLVQTDMESLGYAFAAIAFPAASVGAPQIRDRLYWVGHAHNAGPQRYARDDGEAGWQRALGSIAASGVSGRMANLQGERWNWGEGPSGLAGWTVTEADESVCGPGPVNGFWRGADWLCCRDARWRPVESGTFPLVDGVSNRVGLLRGYGNAIVPEQAQAFIESLMEVLA